MTSPSQVPQSRPTELAITIATLPGPYADREGWVVADNVAHRLKLMGFDCTAQQAASWLARMSRSSCPWVERRVDRWGQIREYRVTAYGKTDMHNQLALDPRMPWLPTYRSAAA